MGLIYRDSFRGVLQKCIKMSGQWSDDFKRHASWVFVINNPTAGDLGRIDGLVDSDETDPVTGKPSALRYLAVSDEVGESGTPHLQGYLELTNGGKVLQALRKWLSLRGSYAPRHGTPLQAAQYAGGCGGQTPAKAGSRLRREVGKITKQGAREDLKTIPELVRQGATMTGMMEAGQVMNSATMRFAEGAMKILEPARVGTCVTLWIWGPSGAGKSYAAMRAFPGAFLKKATSREWWDGYDGEDVVILDDFRDSHMSFGDFIGITDPAVPARVQVKGGMRQLRATTIVVTSVFPPSEIYKAAVASHGAEEPREQINRRIAHVEYLAARTAEQKEAHKTDERREAERVAVSRLRLSLGV